MVRLFQSILDHEMEVVALIEDLAVDVGVVFLEKPDLLVFFVTSFWFIVVISMNMSSSGR